MIYYVSTAVIGLLLVTEHRLVNPDDLTHINTAFFTVNSFVSVVYFFGVLLDKIF
jgi:4-hydroxybenzoate polyprenyltransferase